jgi:PIN domain nuclease of toxin-antitoxin system
MNNSTENPWRYTEHIVIQLLLKWELILTWDIAIIYQLNKILFLEQWPSWVEDRAVRQNIESGPPKDYSI